MRTRVVHMFIALSFLFSGICAGQAVPEDPAEALAAGRKAKKEGLACLKKARSGEGDQRTLAKKAMKLLEHAQECYEVYIDAKGDDPQIDEEMSELQSLIYWTRKMTPMAEEEEEEAPAPKKKEEPRQPVRRAEPPPEASPESQARALFENAQNFERQHPDEFFAISARYFEVVDRYRETSYGERAYEKCMDYQRKLMIRNKAKAQKNAKSVKKASNPSKASTYTPSSDLTLVRLSLRHPKPSIRKANVLSLFGILHRKALTDLHRMFYEDRSEQVLDTACQCLSKLNDAGTLRFVNRKIENKDAELGAKLIRLAKIMNRAEYVRVILKVLCTNTRRVVPGRELKYVVRGEQGYVPPYASDVESAFSHGLRELAVSTIREMGKKGITGLKKCLKGTSRVTCEAILATGILKEKKMSGQLSVFLQRKNKYAYRTEAMAALYIIGVDAVPYLIRNLRNSALRNWSAFLLREITKEDWGMNDGKKFMAWYRSNRG